MLLAGEVLEEVEVCFAGEALRINLLYVPDAAQQDDNLDLSAIEYATIKTEDLEIRFKVTDLDQARYLGGDMVTRFQIPGLQMSLVQVAHEPAAE